jgi:hypothetical protein
VIARPRRRRFTAEYKRSIIDQADAAQDSRAVGGRAARGPLRLALDHLEEAAKAGRDRRAHGQEARPQSGCQSSGQAEPRAAAVIARLTKMLKNAELIIEVPKKVAALLGNPIPNIRIDEENL